MPRRQMLKDYEGLGVFFVKGNANAGKCKLVLVSGVNKPILHFLLFCGDNLTKENKKQENLFMHLSVLWRA